MEFLIPGCVEESLHINLELQTDFSLGLSQSMEHTLMGFQLHLVTQEITFGHLLPHEKTNVDVLALGTELLHLHLLKVTTFVKLEYKIVILSLLRTIHYGMVRAVLPSRPAVS